MREFYFNESGADEKRLKDIDFTQFEVTEGDSDQLKELMDTIELSDHTLGIMGWEDYKLFNTMCNRILKGIYNKEDSILIHDTYMKKTNKDIFDNSQDMRKYEFSDVANYANVRCLRYNDTNLFKRLQVVSNDDLLNNIIKKIAMDQWEAIKYKFIHWVKDMKIDEKSRDLLIKDILCPLYDADQSYRYSTEKFGVTSSQFIKSIILELPNNIELMYDKKILYRIARHIDLLKENIAIKFLLRLNTIYVKDNFTQEIWDLINNSDEIKIKIKNVSSSVQRELSNALMNLNFLDINRFNASFKKSVYLLRQDCRIKKLAQVLDKGSREKTVDYIKQYNLVFQELPLNSIEGSVMYKEKAPNSSDMFDKYAIKEKDLNSLDMSDDYAIKEKDLNSLDRYWQENAVESSDMKDYWKKNRK